jgi:hypothetical protein
VKTNAKCQKTEIKSTAQQTTTKKSNNNQKNLLSERKKNSPKGNKTVSTEQIRTNNQREKEEGKKGTSKIGLSWGTSAGGNKKGRGNAGKSEFHVEKQFNDVSIVNPCDATIARTDFCSEPDATLARTDFCSEPDATLARTDFCSEPDATFARTDLCSELYRSNFCLDLQQTGNTKKRFVECTMMCTDLRLRNKCQIRKCTTRYFNWNRFSVKFSRIQHNNKMIRNAVGKKGKNGVYLKEYG